MGAVRFTKVIEAAGRPVVHVLWVDPAKDIPLQKAIHANRVMTLHQMPADRKADYGFVGFEKNVPGQILIFPKSLKSFTGKRVIGLKYELLDDSAPGKAAAGKKMSPKRRPENKSKVAAGTARAAGGKRGNAKIIKFPRP